MQTLVGKIVCERVNVGSRSEGDGYFIVMDDGRRQRITFKEEPYLDQPTLAGLVDKRCEASGEEFWGKLIVEIIQEVK